MATSVPYWNDQVPLTQDNLLALFDRLLPDFYLAPLKSPGPGYEYLQAVAKMNARVSEAVAHIGSGSYIGSATGGTYATSKVEFYRDNTVFGAVTLLKGTVVGTADGYLYQTMADVVFGASDLGPHEVSVQATARGWNWNKPGPSLTKAGDVLPGSIVQLVAPVVSSSGANFDPTMQVRQTEDAVGGSSPMLDGLGQDRGAYRRVTPATIYLERSNVWPVTILADSRLKTADGFIYRTLDPVIFAQEDMGPHSVRAVPLIQGTQAEIDSHGQIAFNTAGIDILRWGSTQPDVSIGVQPGTQTAYLKESDASYRARIAFLPETVSIVALARLVNQIIGQALRTASETWSYREIWDIRYQTAYSETYTGVSALNFPVNQTFNTAEINVVVPDYSSNIFAYDYAPSDLLSNRYLAGFGTSQLVIELPDLGTSNNAIYAGLASSLEQAKPAGLDIAYILSP